jgi:hypothetical protein
LSYPIPLKGHRILESAWQSRVPVWLKNVGADPRVDREAFERFPHRSNLFCPMLVHGKPIGGLFVTRLGSLAEWTVEVGELDDGHRARKTRLMRSQGCRRRASPRRFASIVARHHARSLSVMFRVSGKRCERHPRDQRTCPKP